MDEKKKIYSIVGKVEIGTDEYRDLIEGLATANAEADRYRSRCWEAESNVKKLESELTTLKNKYDEFRAFIASDEGNAAKFRLFQYQRAQEKETC